MLGLLGPIPRRIIEEEFDQIEIEDRE